MAGALTVEQMEFLEAKGLSLQDVISFAKMSEKPRSKGAERIARWRAKKRGDVTDDVTGNATCNALPLPKEDHTLSVPSDEETSAPPKVRRKRAVPKPDGVTERVWLDFTGQRKTPVSETAIDGICAEAEKAGWTLNAALAEAVKRGWQSFNADWVTSQKTAVNGQGPPSDFLAHLVSKQRTEQPA